MTALLILNILDYLTTIYCLENIPNAYEANPWIQTPEVMFKSKILYGIPIGIAGILLAFLFERFRTRFKARIKSRFVDFWYYLWLIFVLTVFVDYIFTVAGNVSVIIKYGCFGCFYFLVTYCNFILSQLMLKLESSSEHP